MTSSAAGPPVAPGVVQPEHDLRGVLRVVPFRRLWTALSLSSLGDWLGLLALTALAPRLAESGYAAANLAIAGVFILRLAPAILVGPLAGVVADRLDRRWTMVVCDLARFVLFASIPLVGTLWWLFTATLLIEIASLVWIPAKEATVPNLVPRERLESANQLSLFTTYGTAPVAAAIFAGLALLTGILDNPVPGLDEVDLALAVNSATFLVSAVTILRLTDIPAREHVPKDERTSVWRTAVDGWRFVLGTRLVRGLVFGMLGAFAAGGAVIGLARTFVTDLGAGDAGYGLLFGTVFVGLAGGMLLGPRMVPDLSRRRLFGLAVVAAGIGLSVLALVPNMVVAVLVTLVIGACTGVAWVTGYTLLGLEVADEVRGRTFAFVQTMVRVVLVLVLAVSPLLAAAFGRHQISVTDAMVLTYSGAAITFLLAGLLMAGLGVVSYRHLDDRRGAPLSADLAAAYRKERAGSDPVPARAGFFLVLEGGEGAGKSTQARRLAQWIESLGHEVVVTYEPGGTDLGRRLRTVLLDRAGTADEGSTPPALSPRTEALLFAADRAEHVATVVAPALARGQVVISDRYVDSSVAYQGAGRELGHTEVARVSAWATEGLLPDLTVLLDMPPADGLGRVATPDRLESEPLDFHERVRDRFLALARAGGAKYLVVDATLPPEVVTAAVQAQLEPMLPRRAEQPSGPDQARAAAAAAAAARVTEAAEQARARAAAAQQARETAMAQELARAKAEAERQARAKADEAELRRRAAAEAEELRVKAAAEAEELQVSAAAEALDRRAREQVQTEQRRLRRAAVVEARRARRAAAAEQRREDQVAAALAREQRAAEHRQAKQDRRQAREDAQLRIATRHADRHDDRSPRQAARAGQVSLTDELFGAFPETGTRAEPQGGGRPTEVSDAADASDDLEATIPLPQLPGRGPLGDR